MGADEVVTDECDGEEQCGRDEAGLSEEAAVDAYPLVAVGAYEAFDEGAPVERQRPARGLPGVVLPVAFEEAVQDGQGLAAAAVLAGGQVVVGMVCGIRIDWCSARACRRFLSSKSNVVTTLPFPVSL